MKKPNLVQRYMSEIIDYGGFAMTRAEVIRDMQQMGLPQPSIDRWFQGYELRKSMDEGREEKQQAELEARQAARQIEAGTILKDQP